MRWKSLAGGVGMLLLGWLLPMRFDQILDAVQWGLILLGDALVLWGAWGVSEPLRRRKRDSSIRVKMRDNNQIGRIGSDYDGREG